MEKLIWTNVPQPLYGDIVKHCQVLLCLKTRIIDCLLGAWLWWSGKDMKVAVACF